MNKINKQLNEIVDRIDNLEIKIGKKNHWEVVTDSDFCKEGKAIFWVNENLNYRFIWGHITPEGDVHTDYLPDEEKNSLDKYLKIHGYI